MSSFKKLSRSDVSVVPYYANKQWNLSFDYFPTSSEYLTIYKGTNIAGTFYLNEITSEGQYERLIYTQINQLFYQSYTSSLDTSSLANSIYYESASEQRPTASYFIYNDNSKLIQNFPTGSNAQIRVIAINQSLYSNKILPYSFQISSSNYFISDDGYGNLYNLADLPLDPYIDASYFNAEAYFQNSALGEDIHIGNIYYAHGLAIITNPSYQTLSGSYVISFKNEHIIYEHEVRCLVKESDFNLSYNPSLVSGSYSGGVVKNFATGSNFYTYATAIGLYNDNNELLAVAKFGKPMLISPDTDMTFVVKYDT
jgi:hypothetical protein